MQAEAHLEVELEQPHHLQSVIKEGCFANELHLSRIECQKHY